MIPSKFISASLTDNSMMLAEDGNAMAAFFTRAKNPETFDAWAAHIRENWTEQPGQLFGWLRPESETEQATA